MRTQRDECQRCHGLMVECYSDVASPDYTGQDVIGRRCVNCGEYVDRLVLLNRWAQCGQALAKTHDDDFGCGNVTHRSVVNTVGKESRSSFERAVKAHITTNIISEVSATRSAHRARA